MTGSDNPLCFFHSRFSNDQRPWLTIIIWLSFHRKVMMAAYGRHHHRTGMALHFQIQWNWVRCGCSLDPVCQEMVIGWPWQAPADPLSPMAQVITCFPADGTNMVHHSGSIVHSLAAMVGSWPP